MTKPCTFFSLYITPGDSGFKVSYSPISALEGEHPPSRELYFSNACDLVEWLAFEVGIGFEGPKK